MTRLTRLFKQTRGSMRPTLDDIFYAVLEAFDIDDETYRNIKDSREALAVSVRQVICWIGQKSYGYSQHEIGLYLGLNHSTVWHNKMRAEDYMSYDKDYKVCVNKALSILYAKEEEIQKEYSINGWVARDGYDDSLAFFTVKKPKRIEDMWLAEDYCYSLPKEAFPQITWDCEPQECEMTLRLK